MINSNKCRNKKILGFAWKGIKTQGTSGGIRNVEIRVVQLLYHFEPTFKNGKKDIEMVSKCKTFCFGTKTLQKQLKWRYFY